VPAAFKQGLLKLLLGKNWYPVDLFKHTLCGTLHHFGTHNGPGAENDWNSFIIPDVGFAFLLDDLQGHVKPGAVKDCEGEGDCIEAEVTPDEAFFDNPWFNLTNETSELEGRKVCTYGPWVWEEAHGNRPEIHPSELYWWQDVEAPASTYLLLVQDDSDRFDRNKHFSVEEPAAWWRPWAKFPLTGEFKIAFEVPAAPASPATYRIDEVEALNVATADVPGASVDVGPGTVHELSYNGSVVLRVTEKQPRDDDVGVRFVRVCRDAGNSRLRGYIAITGAVGAGDKGGEGYQVLQVTPEAAGEPPVAELGERTTVVARALPATLRSSDSIGTPGLTVDMLVQVGRRTHGLSGDDVLTQVEIVQGETRRAAPLGPRSVALETVVSGVPVLEAGQLEYTFPGGETVRQEAPAVGLAALVSAEEMAAVNEAPMAWPSVTDALGFTTFSLTEGASSMRVTQWQLDVAAAYGAIRDSEVALEEDSPVAERLNELLFNGAVDEVRATFGRDVPIEFEWSFEAVNFATREQIPVTVDATGGAGVVRVSVSQERNISELVVLFSSDPDLRNVIIELTATARIIDPFGKEARLEHTLWSHVLSGESEQALAESMFQSLEAVARVGRGEFAAAAHPDAPLVEQTDPRARRLRIAHTLTLRASEDARITIGELRNITAAARRVGG
jgi:hypothetical protein